VKLAQDAVIGWLFYGESGFSSWFIILGSRFKVQGWRVSNVHEIKSSMVLLISPFEKGELKGIYLKNLPQPLFFKEGDC